MDRRQSLLLGLLAALVTGLYLLSVGIGAGDGTADPERSGGVELLDDILAGLPGLGRSLSADDVSLDCFDGQDFRLDGDERSCTLPVPSGVDRLILRPMHSSCRVEVAEQAGIGRQSLDAGDADADGELRIGLSGDGVDITLSIGVAAAPCVLRLV